MANLKEVAPLQTKQRKLDEVLVQVIGQFLAAAGKGEITDVAIVAVDVDGNIRQTMVSATSPAMLHSGLHLAALKIGGEIIGGATAGERPQP